MSSSGPPVRSHAFAVLDGWRGLCALLVALFHFRTQSHIENLSLVRNAHLFVDFFFVLSGFVVSYAYFDRLNTGREVAIMAWRRFARLWPLHVVMLALFIVFELGSELVALVTGAARSVALFDPNSDNLLSAIPTNLLLIHSLGVHDRTTWNQPSWSISTEFWTYLVFAMAVRMAGKRSTTMAILFAAFAALILILSTDRLTASQHDLGFFRCIYGFFIGYLTYAAFRATPDQVSRHIGNCAEIAMASIVLVFVAYFGLSQLSFAAPLVFGATVWVFAHGNGLLSRALKWRPIAQLGVWSYSIYMVHALVIALINKVVTVAANKIGVPLFEMVPTYGELNPTIAFGGPWMMDLLVIAYLALIVSIAAMAWRFIEIPAQRWLNARLHLDHGQLHWNDASRASVPVHASSALAR